ncbi:hypothetical protein D3C87_1714620 [compost metagenome]
MRTAFTGSPSNGVSRDARSAGGRNALIARTALSRTCGAGLFKSRVARFNACSLGYSGNSANKVARWIAGRLLRCSCSYKACAAPGRPLRISHRLSS